jgi:hypothetical protein
VRGLGWNSPDLLDLPHVVVGEVYGDYDIFLFIRMRIGCIGLGLGIWTEGGGCVLGC